MKLEDQIKVAAELDGKSDEVFWDEGIELFVRRNLNGSLTTVTLPSYPTSYDAIIPLIQKQDIATKMCICCELDVDDYYHMLERTPAQLLEALLRATRKWKE